MPDGSSDAQTRIARLILRDEDAQAKLQRLAAVPKEAILAAFEAKAQGLLHGGRPIKDVAADAGVPTDEIIGAAALATLLLGGAVLPEDRVPYDNVLSDLVDAEALDKEASRKISEVLSAVSEKSGLVEAVISSINSVVCVASAFPQLEHIHTKCVLLNDFTPEYSLADDPDEYEPKIVGRVPAVCIQMDVNEFGDTKSISMGFDCYELEKLIRRLQLALKQLQVIAREDQKH